MSFRAKRGDLNFSYEIAQRVPSKAKESSPFLAMTWGESSSLLTVTNAQDVPGLRIMFSWGQEEKNSKEMSTNGKNKENKGIILSTKVYSQKFMAPV
jgi:hypothetical protein